MSDVSPGTGKPERPAAAAERAPCSGEYRKRRSLQAVIAERVTERPLAFSTLRERTTAQIEKPASRHTLSTVPALPAPSADPTEDLPAWAREDEAGAESSSTDASTPEQHQDVLDGEGGAPSKPHLAGWPRRA
jgi:hypothetical protein